MSFISVNKKYQMKIKERKRIIIYILFLEIFIFNNYQTSLLFFHVIDNTNNAGV